MFISEKYLKEISAAPIIKGVKTVGTVGGKKLLDVAGTVVGIVMATSLMTKRAQMGCNKFDKPETQKVYWRCKEVASRKAISNLKSQKSKCRNTKDPDKCNSKIDNEIDKYKGRAMEAKENRALYK